MPMFCEIYDSFVMLQMRGVSDVEDRMCDETFRVSNFRPHDPVDHVSGAYKERRCIVYGVVI